MTAKNQFYPVTNRFTSREWTNRFGSVPMQFGRSIAMNSGCKRDQIQLQIAQSEARFLVPSTTFRNSLRISQTPFNICRDGQCLTPDFGQDPVRLLEGLKSPWPYLSEVDERLSMILAGPHWPWKSNMSERLQAPQTANNFFVVGEKHPNASWANFFAVVFEKKRGISPGFGFFLKMFFWLSGGQGRGHSSTKLRHTGRTLWAGPGRSLEQREPKNNWGNHWGIGTCGFSWGSWCSLKLLKFKHLHLGVKPCLEDFFWPILLKIDHLELGGRKGLTF